MRRRRFAQETTVATDRSRSEIEKLLSNYGADQFLYGWQEGAAVIGFRCKGRSIRFHLPDADRKSDELRLTPTGRDRSEDQIDMVLAQEKRRRWRALTLAIKAKLEACETGIALFEDEFLAYTVLPNGETVGAWAKPQLENAYAKGKMPSGLLLLTGKTEG